MQHTSLAKLVKEELSGTAAKAYVAGLTRHHRIQGSPMMRKAAEHVIAELESAGLDEVSLEELPADGKRKYWNYTSVIGWDVRGAELRMVEPHRKVLARFSDVPQSLHAHSAGTPEGGVTAELVDVGKGTSDSDYSDRDVKGKMVLATGKAKRVHIQAVLKRGAAGVVTDSLAYEFHGVRESTDVPDAHSYQGIWPDAEEARKIRFGFSLSKRQGNELRRLLHDGEAVKLHAEVDAALSPGKYSIVTARIPGSERPDDEIFLVAHLCHPKPGANDNASGSGLLMEIARTMTALISSGRIDRPKRSIRFIWVPETVGSVAYLSEHPEMHDRLIAGINLDMVGEDQSVCGSTLCMDCTPDTLPSYLNDFVYSMVEAADGQYDAMAKLGIVSNFRRARTAFTGGSDHAEFNEATVGAPCVSLTQWLDRFYHTSMDTMDKVSEDSLRRTGWTVAVSALTLADADTETVHHLASLTCSNAMSRISEAVAEAASVLFGSEESEKRARTDGAARHASKLGHVIRREVGALRSLRRLDEPSGSDAFVEDQVDAVERHGADELERLGRIVKSACGTRKPNKMGARTESERLAETIVPRRRFKGTLDEDAIVRALGDAWSDWHAEADSKDSDFSRKTYEMTCLMDGRRTLREIVEFVSAEYGPTDYGDAVRLTEHLGKLKLVTWQ